MYPHSPLWHYLWLAPHILQVLIVSAITGRKLVKNFPIFLTYTAYQAVIGLVLFVLDHHSGVTAEEYWAAHLGFLCLSVVLRFAVIYEVFANIFRQYEALARLSALLMRWAFALLLLLAVLVTAFAPSADDLPRLAFAIHALELGVNIMQAGLVMFLFMFSSYFRVPLKSYLFGIAGGVGLFAAVSLVSQAIGLASGPAAGTYILDFVTMAAYHCSVVIWLAYLLLPESQGRAVATMPNHDLEEWNHELQRLLLQ